MYALIITIHIIACLILVVSILLQSGRGGGLSDLFGGAGSTQTIFGTRASTFLTRITTTAAIAFLLTCIGLTILSTRKGKSVLDKEQPFIQQQSVPLPDTGLEEKQQSKAVTEVNPEAAKKEPSAESEAPPQLPQE